MTIGHSWSAERVAQHPLAAQIGLDRGLGREHGGQEIVELERERRLAVGAGVPLAGRHLVRQLRLPLDLEEVEIDPRAVDVGRLDIGRQEGDRHGPLRAQERAQGPAGALDGPVVGHA